MKEKTKNRISISLIIIAIIVNFVNSIFFCEPGLTCINPFYSGWSFLEFLAGTLGIAIFPLLISVLGSVFFVKVIKSKFGYILWFGILFLILSFHALYISYWHLYLAP